MLKAIRHGTHHDTKRNAQNNEWEAKEAISMRSGIRSRINFFSVPALQALIKEAIDICAQQTSCAHRESDNAATSAELSSKLDSEWLGKL